MHKGVDFGVPVGTSVVATGAGIVAKAGWENPNNHGQGYGLEIVIDHGNGNISRVGHLERTSVKVGQKVERGQEIGKSGNSGKSTAPHVHYEESHDNKAHRPTFNPAGYRGTEDKDA